MKHMDLKDRIVIQDMLEQEISVSQIAEKLNRSKPTIYREIHRRTIKNKKGELLYIADIDKNIMNIKKILNNYEQEISHIHERIIAYKREIRSIEEELALELSLQSPKYGSKIQNKSHSDMTDMYLKYIQMKQEVKKTLYENINKLILKEEIYYAVWNAMQFLNHDAYQIIYKLYVENQLYDTVQAESGYSHYKFESIRKKAIEELQKAVNYKKSLSKTD